MAYASDVFELLADSTRRRLLVQLCDEKSIDVSRGVPVRGSSRGGVTYSDRRATDGRSETPTAELQHHHLPKLESHGVIEWDRDTSTVTRGPAFEEVDPLLRLLLNNPHKLPSGIFS